MAYFLFYLLIEVFLVVGVSIVILSSEIAQAFPIYSTKINLSGNVTTIDTEFLLDQSNIIDLSDCAEPGNLACATALFLLVTGTSGEAVETYSAPLDLESTPDLPSTEGSYYRVVQDLAADTWLWQIYLPIFSNTTNQFYFDIMVENAGLNDNGGLQIPSLLETNQNITLAVSMTDGTIQTVRISLPAPVPEPATIILLGTGILGLAGFGRKKLFQK